MSVFLHRLAFWAVGGLVVVSSVMLGSTVIHPEGRPVAMTATPADSGWGG